MILGMEIIKRYSTLLLGIFVEKSDDIFLFERLANDRNVMVNLEPGKYMRKMIFQSVT